MTLSVAVVGCGRMGAHHARTVAQHPRTELVACVDVLPERSHALAVVHGARAPERCPAVDLAIVATPTSTHRAVATPLVRAGAWVLVEKPLGLDHADALVHPRALVGHCERFNPAVRAAKVRGVRQLRSRRLSPPPDDRALDVDVIADLMVHDLDLLLSWADDVTVEAVEVRAWRQRHPEWVVAHLAFSGGTAVLEASRVARVRERGMVLNDDGGEARLDLLRGHAERSGRRLSSPPEDALTAQLSAVVDTLCGQDYCGATSAAGRRAVELADAVRRGALR